MKVLDNMGIGTRSLDSGIENSEEEFRNMARNRDIGIMLQNQHAEILLCNTNIITETVQSEVCTFTDIADRKLIEMALIESEAKFRQTFDLLPIGIVMVSLDKHFLHCNKAFSDSVGYLPEELEGKTIEEVTCPDDRQFGMTEMQSIINRETETSIVQKRYIHKNGSIIWGEETTSLRRDKNNKPLYFITGVRDITERKKAETELRFQSEIMRIMVEAVYLVRIADGIIVYSNSQFEILFGYGPGEMVGKHVSIVNVPFEKKTEETAAEIKKIISVQGHWEGEVENIRKDGTHFWCYASVSIFDHLQFGKVLISVHTDITNRKRTESEIGKQNAELGQRIIKRTEQLEAANKDLEAFTYSVSHDLRSPLRSVRAFTKILTEEYETILDEEGKRICRIITSSATHMDELIDNLLSFSKIGRSQMASTLINMRSMAASVYEEIIPAMEKSRTKLRIGTLPETYGDPNLIRLVWVNLISNAIKYSSKEKISEITIGSRFEEGKIIYFIADNGVGFDMHYVHNLFRVFQRLHSEEEFEGNGVGLAIVQRIILRHGGKVWAEGEVGKGALFHFSLPVKNKR